MVLNRILLKPFPRSAPQIKTVRNYTQRAPRKKQSIIAFKIRCKSKQKLLSADRQST